MFKKLLLICAVASVALVPTTSWSANKMAVEPTGAARASQYAKVLKNCQAKYGTGLQAVRAEWGTHFGETHWWCKHR